MRSLQNIGIALVVGLVSIVNATVAMAQPYPSKAVRIVATPAGGGGDFVGRLIADGISGPLGQPVIIDNRPTNLGGEIVYKTLPDGYTLLIAGSAFMIAPLLAKVPYDPVRDFSPVTLVTRSPFILVVHPSLPVKNVKDLIALAKAKPGALNYASGSIGGDNHLAAAQFAYLAKVNIVNISYKGSAQSMTDVVTGVVQMTFESPALVIPQVQLGRLKALAVSTAQPSALYPDLPTINASLPGYDSAGRLGIWVPANTPMPIIRRLNEEVVRVLNQPDVKDKLLKRGVESSPSTPEEFAVLMKRETEQMAILIKQAGVHVE